MEEDNADDIIKWLFKESTKLDCQGAVDVRIEEGARETRWQAALRGNLLGLKPLDLISEPLLFVCEKLEVGRSSSVKNALTLKQCNKEFLMIFPNEEELSKWIVKLSTCTHRIAQAEYDQILCAHFTPFSNVTNGPITPFSYFLSSPITKEQPFSLFQSANMPNKQIICRETMYESKLSLLIPQKMVELSKKWTTELRDELLEKLWMVRNSAIVDTLHMVVRHLNSNIEIHTQASEFLDAYAGPFFRASTEKYRVSFLYVPTNMHVQLFHINDKQVASFVTAGALAALPLRFSNGGLYRLRDKFVANLSPNAIDHTNESRFYERRQNLQTIKRRIGDLSRRIETVWRIEGAGKVDKVGIELFSEAKQLRETISDTISTFPNIGNLLDSLCEGGMAQMQHKGGEAVPRDTLSNQLDLLEAQFVSLNSKIAAFGIEKSEEQNDAKNVENFGENIRSSFHLALDALHHLTLSIEFAQILSLVQCLRNRADCQSFFHLQLRHDALLSQAITTTVTALLTTIHSSNNADALSNWELGSPLLTCFSFLSCYGDEQGMLEDAFEIWQMFPSVASFRFIASSSASRACIPQIEGFRTKLKISIPLHPDKLKTLPGKMAAGEWFCPVTIYWNLGINHEASLAASVGDISLEEKVNRTALKQMSEHVILLSTNERQLNNAEIINRLFSDLQQTVSANASRKNTAIFTTSMALNYALGGMCVLSCKSGKDRTSMAVTLEEGRILKETRGISNQQMREIVDCFRKTGARRENCRKNIGKPLYSFSPFQMNFLPKEFRPPIGTFTNMVAS